MRHGVTVLVVVMVVAALCAPVAATTTSMTGVSSGDETENDVRVMKTDATRPADLEVFVRNGSVEPGERQTVFVQLVNTGNENAESVVVNLSAGRSPFRILDGPQRTQRVQAGGLAEVSFEVAATPNATDGTYELPATVRYTDADGRQVTDRVTVDLEVELEDPRFEVNVPEPTLTPGQRQQLTVQVTNDAEDVEDRSQTAQNVEVTLENGSTPIEVESGTRLVGPLPDGQPRDVPFQLTVPRDLPAGTYELPVRVRYEFDDERETETTTATVRVDRRSRFSLVDSRSDVAVGETGEVTVTVRNEGEETARDATVTLSSRSGDVVVGQSGSESRFVGAWEPGATRTVEFQVDVTDDATTQGYALGVQVGYTDKNGNPAQSMSLSTGLTPAPERSFGLGSVNASLGVGEQGTVTGSVENEGETPARDAVLVLQTKSETLQPVETEYALGTLEAGASGAFSFEISVPSSASAGPKQLTMRLRYRDTDGDERESDALETRVDVSEPATFSLSETGSNLRVGAEGTVTGTVRNDGEATARNAVVVLTSTSPTLTPKETEFAVGTLDPGATEPFEFDVEVSDTAESGPRQFTYRVRYRNADGETRESDPLDARQSIGERMPTFGVEPVSATYPAGGGGRLELEITNNDDGPVTDVSAKLFVDDPLSASDDEAFVDRLESGASATVVFEVSVGSGAIPKNYPLSVDFRYDDAEGDTLISDTVRVPVQVTATENRSGLPVGLIGGVVAILLVAVGAGFYVVRRR